MDGAKTYRITYYLDMVSFLRPTRHTRQRLAERNRDDGEGQSRFELLRREMFSRRGDDEEAKVLFFRIKYHSNNRSNCQDAMGGHDIIYSSSSMRLESRYSL